MNPNLTISIGLIASIAAGFACAIAQRIAKARHWKYVPRYVTGVAIGLVALVFPLFATLETNDAIVVWGVAALIFAGEGIATWIAHDADPEMTGRTPEADRLLREIDEELRK
jgi:hypothetical protein